MLKPWADYTDLEIAEALRNALAPLTMDVRLPWPIVRAALERVANAIYEARTLDKGVREK